MCGICGYWTEDERRADGAWSEPVQRMVAALRHRGPDGAGVWRDEAAGLALGHSRLAVVDRSPLGRQPMVSADGRLVLTYNGEIYNFPELRCQLERLGHAFRGRADSEVLLAAIAQWGLAAALERAEGMFAFAVWDRRTRRLSLARDRVGKKPLYYGWSGKRFLFGSELKAFHALPWFSPAVDRETLGLFLQHGWVPAPRTIYRDVRQLAPGTVLTLSHPGDRTARPERFWSVGTACEAGQRAPFAGSFEAATNRLETLLAAAVRRRLLADVPLGALLSGGIDSSAVVALMQAQSSRPVRTFTIGFAESSHDEALHARAVAAHLGTDHAELVLTPADALALVPRLADIHDEPFADSSMLAATMVCQLARGEVTVALSGDGGDELFAGYSYYAQAQRRWQRLSRRSLTHRRLQADCMEWAGSTLWRLAGSRSPISGAELARNARALRAVDLVDHHVKRRRQHLTDPAALVVGSVAAPGQGIEAGPRPRCQDALRAVRLADFQTWLPDDLLVKIDRASMAVGLEVRCPLLDRSVVEFAWTLPEPMLVGPAGGKRILRTVLARHVPVALTERPKGGFDVPLRGWLLGPLRDWAEDLLDPARLKADGYLQPEVVTRLWRQFASGWDQRHHLIWAILMFQLWRQRWARSLARAA